MNLLDLIAEWRQARTDAKARRLKLIEHIDAALIGALVDIDAALAGAESVTRGVGELLAALAAGVKLSQTDISSKRRACDGYLRDVAALRHRIATTLDGVRDGC